MEAGTRLKSAYELAMERLAAKEGPLKKLTEEQKARIAEIEQKAQAKIAELKIMNDAKSFQNDNDASKEAYLQQEIAKIREWAEAKKEKIRQGNH